MCKIEKNAFQIGVSGKLTLVHEEATILILPEFCYVFLTLVNIISVIDILNFKLFIHIVIFIVRTLSCLNFRFKGAPSRSYEA
jgi:hypothetical protein